MMALLRSRLSDARYRRGIGWVVMCLVWLCAAAVTWGTLLKHAYQPSKHPSESSRLVSLEPSGTFRIVLFAHPFCPCTRATLTELNESLARLPRDISVSVIFVSRGLKQAEVEASSTVRLAGTLSGADVVIDSRAEEADRFGATISGEVFAFDPAGQLVYHGGLTPGRGHQGDAVGQSLLEQIITGKVLRFCTAPVYGCQLPGN